MEPQIGVGWILVYIAAMAAAIWELGEAGPRVKDCSKFEAALAESLEPGSEAASLPLFFNRKYFEASEVISHFETIPEERRFELLKFAVNPSLHRGVPGGVSGFKACLVEKLVQLELEERMRQEVAPTFWVRSPDRFDARLNQKVGATF